MHQREIKRVEEEREAENVTVFISPIPSSVLPSVVSFLLVTAPIKQVLFHSCGLCWSMMIALPPLDPVGVSMVLVLVFQSLEWTGWISLQSLLQQRSSKASILRHSAFFTVLLSHPYMTTGKTVALSRRTFVGKVMSLLLNMLPRLVITFLPRSKRLLISWLQSPSAVILEPLKIKS